MRNHINLFENNEGIITILLKEVGVFIFGPDPADEIDPVEQAKQDIYDICPGLELLDIKAFDTHSGDKRHSYFIAYIEVNFDNFLKILECDKSHSLYEDLGILASYEDFLKAKALKIWYKRYGQYAKVDNDYIFDEIEKLKRDKNFISDFKKLDVDEYENGGFIPMDVVV